jgi:hypothetical protein
MCRVRVDESARENLLIRSLPGYPVREKYPFVHQRVISERCDAHYDIRDYDDQCRRADIVGHDSSVAYAESILGEAEIYYKNISAALYPENKLLPV